MFKFEVGQKVNCKRFGQTARGVIKSRRIFEDNSGMRILYDIYPFGSSVFHSIENTEKELIEFNKTGNKLRLIMWSSCDRSCPGCCNKDFDIPSLPKTKDFRNYDLIMLTGGEPFLKPIELTTTILEIGQQNPDCRVIVYTAKVNINPQIFFDILELVDGMTVTLHEPSDVKPFMEIYKLGDEKGLFSLPDMRLNVFKGIEVPEPLENWKVKKDIEWIKDCPLPEGEILMKLDRSGF